MEKTMTFEKPAMEIETIVQKIKARFPEAEVNIQNPRMLDFAVAKAEIKQYAQFMRDELGFEHITDLTAIDRRTNLEMVYILNSYRNFCTAEIRAEMPNDDMTIDTVSDVWGGANWHEREAYDMFGIKFNGHPDLRRILLPEDQDIHPLRKTFKLKKDKRWNTESSDVTKEATE